MITVEQIDRLAEYGSFQLGPEHKPADFETFYTGLSQGDPLRALTHMNTVQALLPGFRQTVNTILELAGYEKNDQPLLRKTISHVTPKLAYWHQDFGPNTFPGFSLLFSEADIDGKNCLQTGGRGRLRDERHRREYDYSEGPIVIAQEHFATQTALIGTSALGATWHIGAREVPARFVAIDVCNPKRVWHMAFAEVETDTA